MACDAMPFCPCHDDPMATASGVLDSTLLREYYRLTVPH